jgi:hypothetical protein
MTAATQAKDNALYAELLAERIVAEAEHETMCMAYYRDALHLPAAQAAYIVAYKDQTAHNRPMDMANMPKLANAAGALDAVATQAAYDQHDGKNRAQLLEALKEVDAQNADWKADIEQIRNEKAALPPEVAKNPFSDERTDLREHAAYGNARKHYWLAQEAVIKELLSKAK